jgi:hypothetical protein
MEEEVQMLENELVRLKEQLSMLEKMQQQEGPIRYVQLDGLVRLYRNET